MSFLELTIHSTFQIERESLKNETDTISTERKEVVETQLEEKKEEAKKRDEVWVAEKQWLKNLKEVKEVRPQKLETSSFIY